LRNGVLLCGLLRFH
jgi:hypothetical protein